MKGELGVLVWGKQVDTGTYIVSEMLLEGIPTHLHFNNYKTNKNSAIVPIDAIKSILELDKNKGDI